MKQDLYSHGEFKLFNPNGETFGNKIIGSETTGIMAISEGKYTTSHVSDLYDVMSLNIWNPKRTDLTNDIKTVNELTSYEFDAYIDELGFLTYLDSIQTTFPAQLMRHVTAPEFRLLLSFQPLQEGIHSQSYSYVIESLFKGKQRRDIYDRWRNNKIMFERIEFISKLYQDYIDTPNLYNFFRALIADYILEGLYFYSGFKFFNSLSSKALMTGTNSIINLIQRDEITHITLYERLINLIQAENKNIIPQELFIDIMDIAVQHENKFSISTLCNCVGFSEQIITQYTGYRANLLLKRVGIKDNPYSSFVKNPFVHFDSVAEGTDGVTRESNVFTNQVVDYQFSDAESRWTDDIFDDEDK